MDANPLPDPTVEAIEADPAKPYKAYAGAVLTGVGVFVAAWVADVEPFTGKEAATAALSAVGAMVPAFGIVWRIENPLRRKRRAS